MGRSPSHWPKPSDVCLPYKKHIKTITTDNGPEFAAHKLITKYLGAIVYFADPYASWQKGAIENTNKLIRQYIPKQANFDDITDKKDCKYTEENQQ